MSECESIGPLVYPHRDCAKAKHRSPSEGAKPTGHSFKPMIACCRVGLASVIGQGWLGLPVAQCLPLGMADRPGCALPWRSACRWQAQRCIPKLPCLRKGASQIEVPAPAPVPGLGKRGGCGKRCRVGLASVIGHGCCLGKRCRGCLAAALLCCPCWLAAVPSLGGLPVGCP